MPVKDTLKTAPAVTCMKTLLMVFNFIFWVRYIKDSSGRHLYENTADGVQFG